MDRLHLLGLVHQFSPERLQRLREVSLEPQSFVAFRIAMATLTVNLTFSPLLVPDDKQDSVTKTGGHEYNDPHHSSGDSSTPWCTQPSSSFVRLADGIRGIAVCAVNEDEVVKKATSEGSGDPSLFSSALEYINSSKVRSDHPRTLESLLD
jgi:hypothetical protein